MLVLLSFGLVLVATVLLVLGLLSESGLTLIYVSIGASALAGLALVAAVRLSRVPIARSSDQRLGADPPPVAVPPQVLPLPASEPLVTPEVVEAVVPPEPLAPQPEPWEPSPAPVAPTPEPVVPEVPAVPAVIEEVEEVEEVEPPNAVEPVVAEVPEPIAAPEAVAAAAPDVAEPDPVASADPGTRWDPEPAPLPEPLDFDFPIAEYDDLEAHEIVPLLPQLFADELDSVSARERATKDRTAVLARIDELRLAETDPDARTRSPVRLDPDVPRPDVGDDLFPIEAYDSLTVAQIVPLLRQLEDDELVDVRSREQSTGARLSILRVIEERIGVAPGGRALPPKRVAGKSASSKPSAKSSATKSAAKKARAEKTPAKKAPTASRSKRAAKKPTSGGAKKSAAKKSAAKKPRSAKKAAPSKQRPAAKKSAGRKRPAKKSGTRR